MKIRRLVFGLTSILLAQISWADSVADQIQQLQQQIQQLQTSIQTQNTNALVSTDAGNPLAMLSTPNLAYSLLQAQDQYTSPVNIGAAFAADVQTWGGSHITDIVSRDRSSYQDSGTAVAATTANLYTLANINAWTQAFLMVQGGLNGYQTELSQAFVNFGNLSKTPFYVSLGETYLPFGTFPGGGLVAGSLESSAFASTELAQLDLGFSKDNFNTVFALFNGDSNLNDFVYSLQYAPSFGNFSLTGGAGYMNDIRYSGSGIAAAYGTSNSRYNIPTGILSGGRNSAVDLNANATYNFNDNQALSLDGEWTTTTSSPLLLGKIPTGKMQAWSAALSYVTPILQKDTTFSLGYSATINMQAVPLPLPTSINTTNFSAIGLKNQWVAYVQSEIFNNVYLGPEFARLNLYNGQYTWESTLDLSIYI